VRELATYAASAVRAVGRKLGQRAARAARTISTAMADRGLRAGRHRAALAGRLPREAKSVLVLCKGNICRSPFADRYLAQPPGRASPALAVVSAGLDAIPGREAYPMALTVSPDFGVDLAAHRSQAITDALVDAADVILVMEPEQERQVAQRFPRARSKTFLLGPFAEGGPVTAIGDPYGGTASEFAACFAVLAEACDGFLAQLEARRGQTVSGARPAGGRSGRGDRGAGGSRSRSAPRR
jgi:protein-tyrosine-phosphatase